MSQYDPAYEPTGQYGPGPGYGPPTSTGSALPTPGIASAAAVLGFVEAGLTLAFVVYALAQTAVLGVGDDAGLATLVLLGTIGLSALVLLGGLSLVRGRGRGLLVGATIAELVLVLGLGIWALSETSSVDPYGYSSGIDAAVIAALVIALALPTVRLVLVAQPAVGRWLAGRAQERQATPPVWSPETNAWVPGPGVRSSAGAAIALLAPVVALAVATIVVPATSSEPQVDYATALGPDLGTDFGLDEPVTSSEWSYLYDGGDPVEPPSGSDAEFDSSYDDDAQDCYDGDLGACDDLYSQTPVGSLYEWLGSTCGGRQEEETYGNCA